MMRQGSNHGICRRQEGFTLVELLVVVTIIAILIALLLPAIQMAREAGRRAQCANNVKQLALACMQHEHVHHFLPTGGWGAWWVGDPDRGFDSHQPGGWCFNILPYIEMGELHDLGMGSGAGSAANVAANIRRVTTPLTVFCCPTRRQPTLMPVGCAPTYCGGMPGHVSSCYAANAGNTNPYAVTPGCDGAHPIPGSYAVVDSGSFHWVPDIAKASGVVFAGSMVRMSDITDGSTSTILLGEKHVNPDHYLDGQDGGDDWAIYTGSQDDIVRGCGEASSGYYPLLPMQDLPGNGSSSLYFGSAHGISCNMAMSDASVHAISYLIEAETFRRLCNRMDNLPIDASKF
jgi:prepilin-type N-terminal cleavage/methylation domain-containing protein